MTDLTALWLPILLSAVAVFVVSSLIHMVSPWHKSDYRAVPNQDAVMDALRPFAIPPGDYMMPRPKTRADIRSPEFIEKMNKGPNILMTVMPNGIRAMGKTFVLWFIYVILVSAMAGVIAYAARGRGADDHSIIHFVGLTAFIAYAVALWPMSIWFSRPWSWTGKATVDGIIYAAVTATIFVWLWPH